MIKPSLDDILRNAPWRSLEHHLDDLRERVDASVTLVQGLRQDYREQLLSDSPELRDRIRRPSQEALQRAQRLLTTGTLAAADGTVSPVPLLGGSKIQVGVVIVFNSGEVVNLVTRVFEAELSNNTTDARQFFAELRQARTISNLVSRAIMLSGERRLLLDQQAEWRMLHGELVPHELRVGAGRPEANLVPNFELIHGYIETQTFIAVSESPEDIDVLNAAILLEPGEYIEIRTLADELLSFLEGDPDIGRSRANFVQRDERRFREFIQSAGPSVSIVLVKAGQRPYLIECHHDRVDDAVALFLTDSLWTRGTTADGNELAVRGFPFHLDLADQVARTLFKGSDFRDFVESRLMTLGVEAGLFELDARRTRI